VKDRLIRKVVPSMPVVARWPLLPRALDVADKVVNGRDPRYASLPPASLRMRIGVSNKLLRNAQVFEEGHDLVRRCVEDGLVGTGSRILELGSGVGRNLMALRKQVPFATYDGIDVDPQMVAWCTAHLADASVRFHHADLYSAVYNPGGHRVAAYRFPVDDASIDFSLGVSVFSHLVAADTAHYAAELGRATADGGHASHTFFLLEHVQALLGDRWTFAHELDGCWVENPRYPEAAVAYRQTDVVDLFAGHGLDLVEVADVDRHQQTVVFRRRPR
jgi:hypothetical protein